MLFLIIDEVTKSLALTLFLNKMDEFIQQAKNSENVKIQLTKELYSLEKKSLGEKSKLLEIRTKDAIAFSEAINIMGERIMDVEDELEVKIDETNQLRNYIGVIPQKVEDNIKYRKSEIINKSPEEKKQRLLRGLKKTIYKNKQLTL